MIRADFGLFDQYPEVCAEKALVEQTFPVKVWTNQPTFDKEVLFILLGKSPSTALPCCGLCSLGRRASKR